MQLYDKGVRKTFNMDDRLGFTKSDKLYNAKQSKGGAWWMPLIEKAMAKFNVNYLHLHGGTNGYGFRQLTGMPTDEFSTRRFSDADLISKIDEWDRKKYIMAAACTESQ